ncbi:hypothetical protein ABTY59_01605 [Streptomyces sp. NPDC096079]
MSTPLRLAAIALLRAAPPRPAAADVFAVVTPEYNHSARTNKPCTD